MLNNILKEVCCRATIKNIHNMSCGKNNQYNILILTIVIALQTFLININHIYCRIKVSNNILISFVAELKFLIIY